MATIIQKIPAPEKRFLLLEIKKEAGKKIPL
jgi:hypothetical protein